MIKLKQWGMGTHKFECSLSKEYLGKPVRIRSELNYQYNNIGTPWPLIRFYHDIAHTGILQVQATGAVAEQNKSGPPDPDAGGGADQQTSTNVSNPASTEPGGGQPDISEDPHIDIEPRPIGKYSTGPLISDAGDDHTLAGKDYSVVPDQVELQSDLNDLNKQIVNTTDPAKRKQLNGKRNEIIQALLKYETSSIYMNAAAKTTGQGTVTLADKILGYHPVTGPFWAVTKAMYQAAQGNWQDAAVTATGVLGNVSVAGKVISQTGDKISLFMDGVTVVDKLGPDWDSKPSSPGQHQTKSYGFTHHMAK